MLPALRSAIGSLSLFCPWRNDFVRVCSSLKCTGTADAWGISHAKQVEPFNNNPEFTPEQIEKASKACTAICMWALAMYQYHFVALAVVPKVG